MPELLLIVYFIVIKWLEKLTVVKLCLAVKIIPAIKLAQSGKINKAEAAEAIVDLRMIQGCCPFKSGVI